MGTRERRRREKEDRRRRILETARRIFWKKGFSGTTMPEIARAAELAPGTLYLYFPGKESLYAELLVEGYDRLIARLRKAVVKGAPPRRQAEALIDTFLGFARECPRCFDIIFFLLQREGSSLDAEQASRIRSREDLAKGIAAEVLAAAGLRHPEKRKLLVEAVWSMLAGVVFFWRRDPGKEFAAVTAEARRVILEAVFP